MNWGNHYLMHLPWCFRVHPAGDPASSFRNRFQTWKLVHVQKLGKGLWLSLGMVALGVLIIHSLILLIVSIGLYPFLIPVRSFSVNYFINSCSSGGCHIILATHYDNCTHGGDTCPLSIYIYIISLINWDKHSLFLWMGEGQADPYDKQGHWVGICVSYSRTNSASPLQQIFWFHQSLPL